MGPEGFEPSPFGLKVRCAAVTPQPQESVAYPFASSDNRHRVPPGGSGSSLSGSPGNRTQRHPVISRVRATSPRLPCKSGASESNRNPPVPKTGVLPSAPPPELSVRTVGLEPTISWPPAKRDAKLRYVLICSDPCGSRTRPDRLERPMTSPEVERTVFQNESALAQALFRLGDGPRINANDSSRSAHARVKRFITFTPVVDVSIAQQQAVVQRVFWVRFEHPVGHSHLARPAFYSGK